MTNHVLDRQSDLSIDRINQILNAHDTGKGLKEISEVYNVEADLVHCVIQAAQQIQKLYMTTKSCPRLYSADSKSLSVPMPASTGEVLESNRILKHLAPLSGEESTRELKRAIHEILKRTMHAHRYISLSSPDELRKLLRPIHSAASRKRWLLVIEVSEGLKKEHFNQFWKGVSDLAGNITVRRRTGVSEKYRHGIGRLYFLADGLSEKTHAWMEEKKYNQYSSRAMQAALHALAIYNLSLKLYRERKSLRKAS